MNRDSDLVKLQELQHGKSCTVNWYGGGGGLVYKIENFYFLFEVPRYGGSNEYYAAFYKDELSELLDVAYHWS